MSRAAAALLILTLLAALCTGALAEATDGIPGLWALVTVSVDGQIHSASAIGMQLELTLRADGTATGVSSGAPDGREGTWTPTADGAIVELDTAQAFTLGEDGLLRGESDGVTLALRRVPQPVPAESEAVFGGRWMLTGLSFGSGYQDAVNPGAVRLEISGTEILFILQPAEENAEPETERFEAVFEDGALRCALEGMQIRVQPNDAGGLCFILAMNVAAGGADAEPAGGLNAAYWFARENADDPQSAD